MINKELDKLIEKDIDEQLLLYDFSNKPIQKLDMDVINFFNSHDLKHAITDDGLEISQNILKKVRRINK